MRGFLLDSNLPRAVVPAVRNLAPHCSIVHLATWREGVFLDAADETIIRAATDDDLILVTHDFNTIPDTVHDMIAAGEIFSGVAFCISPALAADVGGLARALEDLFTHPDIIDAAYPVVYLRVARGEDKGI